MKSKAVLPLLAVVGAGIYLASKNGAKAIPSPEKPPAKPENPPGTAPAAIPPKPGEISERDGEILEAISNNAFDQFHVVPVKVNERLTIFVMADGLKIRSIRINAGERTQQLIADLLGMYLLTDLGSDAVFRQAGVQIPFPFQDWSSDGSMASTARMNEYSGIVDRKLFDKVGGTSSTVATLVDTLVADIGKDWILTALSWQDGAAPCSWGNKIPYRKAAVNYGGRDASGKPVQPMGFCHDLSHTDYSQVCRLAGPSVILDGTIMSYADLLKDEQLAPLLSRNGAMPEARHPDILRVGGGVLV